MSKNNGSIFQRLNEEQFDGRNPNWFRAEWMNLEVWVTTSNGNWFYQVGSSIYVQSKPDTNRSLDPHCYGCGTGLVFYEKLVTTLDGNEHVTEIFDIPYCPVCEPKKRELDNRKLAI
jgi:hypothetical protein